MSNADQQLVSLLAALVPAVLGAIVDVRSRRIPNLITGPAFFAGLLVHLYLGGWSGLFTALAAGLLCGAIFLIFYLAGGMGAGDVKLIAAVGALAGLDQCASVLVLTSLAGGAMGVALALARGRLRQTLGNVFALAGHHRDAGLTPHPELNVSNEATLRLPYALPIAAGCAATLLLRFQR